MVLLIRKRKTKATIRRTISVIFLVMALAILEMAMIMLGTMDQVQVQDQILVREQAKWVQVEIY